MIEIWSQGSELIDIIERKDWVLYDTTFAMKEGRAFTWEELEEHSPATQLLITHNYLFVPRPKNQETLRQAYTPTKGLGPSLTIDNPDDPRWVALIVDPKILPGNVAFFSRLFMEPEFVVASSPSTAFNPEPDTVAMPYDSVVDTFRKHYRIVQPREVGASVPIPMPYLN